MSVRRFPKINDVPRTKLVVSRRPQPAGRRSRVAGVWPGVYYGRAAAVHIPEARAAALVALEGGQASCRELRDGARSSAPKASSVGDPGVTVTRRQHQTVSISLAEIAVSNPSKTGQIFYQIVSANKY
jgi:hypothetical protein